MILKVSNAFARVSDSDLVTQTDNVIEKMTGNPKFTNPLVSLADIGTANTGFKATMLAAANGDRLAISDKNAKREKVITLLLQEASYVQGVAAGDMTVLLSSGFQAASTNRAQIELPAPEIEQIDNPGTAQLALRVRPVPTARAYEVRISYGANGWQSVGVFTQARKILLENLTPGTTYTAQVRAIGGSTGYSQWSDPVSHMSL